MSETTAPTEHPLDVLLEAADAALAADARVEVANIGAALHVVHEGQVIVQTTLPEGVTQLASIPVPLESLRQMQADLDAHDPAEHSPEEVDAVPAPAAIEAAPAVEDDEEEDWLAGAPACAIRPDGSVDDECEACQ